MKKRLILLSLCLFVWHSQAESQQNVAEFLESELCQIEMEANDNPQTESEINKLAFLEKKGCKFFPIEKQKGAFSIEKGAFSPFETMGQVEVSDVLSPDAAFVFSTRMETPSLLVARWQIAKKHYLYRDHFQFALKGGVLGAPQFPQGKMKNDIEHGEIEIYEDTLEIKLPISDSQGLDFLTLETTYQGCADEKLCYPPIQKTTRIDLQNIASPIQVVVANERFSKTPNSGLLSDPTSNAGSIAQNNWGDDAGSKGDETGVDKSKVKFLPADEAFIFSAEFSDPSHIVARWKIADGYYLYRDKLKFSLESGELGAVQLPPSLLKQDPKFGDVQIYKQSPLEIILPLKTGQETVALKVKYQGCAVAGLCYSPTTTVVNLSQGGNISEQDHLANLLANANILYTLMVFFGLGLLLSLTPCVFPMIPILSSIIVGQGEKVTTYKAFIMSLIYVLAMAFTYAIVGVLTGLLGENLQAAFQNPWVLISFALIFVILSFSMFGFYELQLPSGLQTKLTNFSNRQQGGTLIGVAIMGILSALIVGPCVAAPLVGALIYIGQTGDAVLGGMALFTMSIGMGIPLIIVGISAGHFLPKAGKWMDAIKAVFGVMLLAVALWMLERIIPGQVTMLLWASLLIISAVYLGALDGAKLSGWRKLWKGLGFILLVYGILLIIGAASGNMNPLQPLQNLSIGNHSSPANADGLETAFKPIKGVEELERELAQNKPVILDFYADWCVSCKEMENFTLSDPKVQELLADFVLLQADVTPNDEQDKALYKHFGIFGPPAILFFDSNGQEQKSYRVVGFMSADDFYQHMKKVTQ
jgi:thiol:disulfide interchange protein DsbD